MTQRWRSLPTLLLCLLIPSFAAASSPFFENSAIVRTVDLGGSLVHVTTTYAAKALNPGAKGYIVALSPDEDKKTSFMEVREKGSKTPLAVEYMGVDDASGSILYGAELPRVLAIDETINLVLDTVQTHATFPWPQTSPQNGEQLLKYNTSIFVVSPYDTVVQRTKVKAPTASVKAYTEPKGVDTFVKESLATKSGSTITYGPFHGIPVVTSEWLAQYQQLVTVHYPYDHPVIELTSLKRSAEISHWGANLNIQDEINLHNSGPQLKGHFSRLEHQSQSFFQRPAPHVMTTLAMHLPAGVRNVYYYDLIGNVSTSRLRTTPSSSSKRAAANQYSLLEMRPRYPLLGGWNYSFTLGFDAPLADSVSYDSKTGKYVVGVPIMTLLPGTVIDEAEVTIILPEGATDAEAFPPFPAKVYGVDTHITYLDTVGRPTYTFKYQQLTDKHVGTIYVTYKVSLLAHLRKPVVVTMAFMLIFAIASIARRVDLRLNTGSSLPQKK